MTILLNKHVRQLLLLIALLTLLLNACAPQTTMPATAPPVEKPTAVPETDEHPTLESSAQNRTEEPDDAASLTAAGAASETAPAASNSHVIEFDPAYSNKFSSMTKFNLLEADLDQSAELNLLVRTNGEPNTKQLKQIEKTGANVRTIADDIITVTATAGQLNDIAALDFVVFIDLSLPLYPESSEENLDE